MMGISDTESGRPMRFAVIGCGHIGKAHCRTLRGLPPRAELAAVVDILPERAAALADEHQVPAWASLEEALSRTDIDAVTLATPSGLHGDQAVMALDAGKHVVIEKPLDVSMEMAQRVLAAERRSERVAMVVSQMRYAPASQVVRQAAQSGAFGRLTSGMVSMAWWRSQAYYDSGDWRGTWSLDGGGALMNQGIHVIDLFRWIMGDPVEVQAWTGCLAHTRMEVEDTAIALVRFRSGALGTIHGTTAAYPGVSRRIQIHGDRGTAVIDDSRLVYYHAAGSEAKELPYGSRLDENQVSSVLPEQPDTPSSDRSDPSSSSGTSHTPQFLDFLDAVSHRRPPLVTVTEGAKTLALICAIYESARSGASVKVTELDNSNPG